MSGEFLGTFENSVHKSRIMIPASFKKLFSEEANNMVVVTIGPLDTIAVYPLDNWYAALAKLTEGNDDKKLLMAVMRNTAMPAQKLEGPGRIRINEALLKRANITDAVVIKGQGEYINLLNPEKENEITQDLLALHKRKFGFADYQLC